MIQKKKFSDAIAANISVVGGLIGTATPEKNGLQDKNFAPKGFSYLDIYNKTLRIDSPCFLFFAHYYEQRLIFISTGETNSYTVLFKTLKKYRNEVQLLTDGKSVAIKGRRNTSGGSTYITLVPFAGIAVLATEISDDGYYEME